ncbi:hypothetical protein FH972_018158 [Carpinus fangiana]|nr:hypothetical protein FH972_018158 [Carpinus fangiana]
MNKRFSMIVHKRVQDETPWTLMNINFTLSQTAMGRARGGLLKVAIFMFVLIQCGVAQQQPRLNSSNDRSALLDLRSSLGLRGKDWPIKSDPCTNWTGVHCQNGRVIGINVSGLRRTRAGRANPQFAVDSLANLTLLQFFNASGFYLPGSIPDLFGQSLNALLMLDLRSCSVTGPIPSSLGNLRTLRLLNLSSNSLTGIIPPALGQLSELSVLDLSQNTLTGSISSGFESLGKLTRLDLSSNFLSGPIPPGLGNLSRLLYLNLSDNSFTSSIPGQLGDLSLLEELDLSKNSLSGSLPVELSGLRSLRGMNIGMNILEGPFPDGLFMGLSSNGNATVVVFNLSNNRLYGTLNLSSVGKFSLLDLSNNYFQGQILDAGQSNVTVYRNCLQMVPAEQRSLEDCRKFYAEKGLTFDNFGSPEPTQLPSPVPDSKTNRRLIYIMVGLFGGIGFIVLLVFVIVLLLRMCNKGIADQRGAANVGSAPEGDSPSFPKDPVWMTGLGEIYGYEQMLHFTGDFSEANLIKHGHSGDIFRGFLEGGIPVVIKKIDLRSFKKESYMMELEFFSKVSHTRLVPLLGHCLEHENEKFLVYKDLPHGDLANSLHRVTNSEDGNLQSLDWITRLKIATGAAEGLAYLHHECAPPLVHRDVQASSILLDDKFEVRLGSLSEVHAQEGDSHQNALTRFLRKPQ